MRTLSQLALSDEGFVFDPNTGDSFQVSATGLFLLKPSKTAAATTKPPNSSPRNMKSPSKKPAATAPTSAAASAI